MIFRRLFGSRDQDEVAPSDDVARFETVDDGDRLIVEQLRSIGADLSKPREASVAPFLVR